MGKLSPEEQATLDRLTRQRDEPDDDDLAVWVRNSDGHETRLTGERAARWLRRNGYDEDDADESTSAEPLDARKGKPAARPAGRKPQVKAPTGKEQEEPEEQEEAPDPEPPRSGPRTFF